MSGPDKVALRALAGICDRPSRSSGFSLFEMTIVLIVMSILLYSGSKYYFSSIEDSKYSVIKFQAATFSRTVSNLYGQAQVQGLQSLDLMGTIIYMNEKGWPATANTKTSLKTWDQSPEECELLWHGIFNNAPSTVVAGAVIDSRKKNHHDFKVYSINGRICRYELMRKQEGRYFFDYDLSTGEVIVFSPEN